MFVNGNYCMICVYQDRYEKDNVHLCRAQDPYI
jgi:hypothetical protein